MKNPQKVAIIGGGCASIATAFELSRPEHSGAFDITVYQYGWRLGGKGASGRSANGRIEEHGLHLWLGYYDNAFQLLRECYDELDRDPATCPIANWQEAIAPDTYVGLMDYDQHGVWRRLLAHFPSVDGLPGDPPDDRTPRTVSHYVVHSVRLLFELIRATQEAAGDVPHERTSEPADAIEQLLSTVQRVVDYGSLVTFGGIAQAALTLEQLLVILNPKLNRLTLTYLGVIKDSAYRLLEPMFEKNAELRLLWNVMDVLLANLRGMIRFGLMWDPRGFDAINDYDSREWLLENGASLESLNSPIVRGLYDLAFAYQEGDVNRPATAAGQGLRGALRMFWGYRGSLFWKMQAGMGDVVFAPMYELLKQRGVKFEFFHRLENVQLQPAEGNEKAFVKGLEFTVQADVKDNKYEPLVDVKGLPCWPAEPLWSQLKEGDTLREQDVRFESFAETQSVAKRSLEVTRDFDFVVLGVGIGAIPIVASELVNYDARWRAMVEHVQSIPTQAFQLWLDRDLTDLGWDRPAPNMSAFVEPFDTWADMTHLGSIEDWPQAPRTIAYFCSVLSCQDFPADYWRSKSFQDEQDALVRSNAINFMTEHLPDLWRNVKDENGEFCWDALKAQDSSLNGEARFNTQFWTANINPSDRYVLALPGTMQYRISPLDGTYDNMTIAGDWTDCGYNYGCVETAIMSGRLAAHALCLSPALEDIHGYDHP